MALSRHETRIKAFQALYQLFFEKNTDLTIEQAVKNAFTGEEDDIAELQESEFLIELVKGALEHRVEIDSLISQHLKNWKIEQLNSVDVLILRMGVLEINFIGDTPAAVVINEMINLSKMFSNKKSEQLINAVLDHIAKSKNKSEEMH
ncbi:MAG: transcription antitermination factor NusB [Atopococcus tabaci]|uniref:Transcription antitermination protein NusB n=1 Tax=Atopococcus tabaci TaxID=269774 RepID=A0AA43RK66_9LACT|nr:transcription antitermination factor NusB [Atopococcus tabaci]